MPALFYRYKIINLHAGKILCISYSDQLFDSVEACLAAAKETVNNMDFCCGLMYEAVAVEEGQVLSQN